MGIITLPRKILRYQLGIEPAQVVSAPCLEAQESSSHEKVPGRHSRRQDRSLLEILRSAAHHYNTNTSKQTQGK
ncbi:unnamed protein product, partial [Timema podura]|nr:unnamed protein product [Timema podura]